jgi:hypothetical protein
MKLKFLIAGSVLFLMLLAAPLVLGQDPFTWEGEINPQQSGGFPLIPISDTESMDVTIDSDIPITVFIIDAQEDYNQLILLGAGDIENFTGYEQKYEDVTYKEISQDYDSEKNYWVALYNPSETETAYITVEWEFFEDITSEIIEEAASEACCGLAMGAGVVAIIGILSGLVILKRRK